MSTNPYLLPRPAVISFSGGRTSGYMLAKIIEAFGGGLPPDVIPVFANTGKEHPLTLQFVNDCERHMGVEIVWIEWQACVETSGRWKRVSYETAARDGEPFDALLGFAKDQDWAVRLPNPVNRICSFNLKAKAIEQYCKVGLGWTEWNTAIGIRADEKKRAAGNGGSTVSGQTNLMPLVYAGVGKWDVINHWKAQPFDLMLPASTEDGSTPEGNCDCCFLKSLHKIVSVVRQTPERVNWWKKKELESGELFRKDRANYATIEQMASQPQLDFADDEEILDCLCP